MNIMVRFPNAKINIGLFVRNKRDDGFHNIETIFYPIKIKDAVEAIDNEAKGTRFDFTGIDLGGGFKRNLCYKAYSLMKERYGIGNIKFHLYKNIPIGAGLGGGSSDCAFTLKLLSELFSLNLGDDALVEMSKTLGSDCAFFIKNKPVIAFGKGDEFKYIDLSFLQQYFIVVVKPLVGVKTWEAYGNVSLSPNKESLENLLKLPIDEWRYKVGNDFESSVFDKYPEIGIIKNVFYEKGAVYASMSGSGSSVYGIFKEELNLKEYFNKDYFYFSSKMSYDDL